MQVGGEGWDDWENYGGRERALFLGRADLDDILRLSIDKAPSPFLDLLLHLLF